MSFRGLTEADGPEGERPLPAPAEEPEGVTVTDTSGYYRMTFCPGNLVYYYMDDYWNFWFQGTGEAELYPLLLEQTDFLVGQSRHDSPEGLKKVVGAGGKGAYVRDALAENRPPVNDELVTGLDVHFVVTLEPVLLVC